MMMIMTTTAIMVMVNLDEQGPALSTLYGLAYFNNVTTI